MKLPVVIRMTSTVLAMLACASLAVAGGGLSLDETPHAHTSAPAHTNPPAVTPHASTSDDTADGPAQRCMTTTNRGLARTAPAMDAAPATPRAPLAPAPDRRADKHEHGRPAPSTALHVHRPVTQRSKGSLRNTPATPGMGLLLRMGTGAGRELSLLLDDVSCAPSVMRSGRAPPRAPTHPTSARDPIACAAAPAPRTVTPSSFPPGVTPRNPNRNRSAGHPQGWELSRVLPRDRDGRSGCVPFSPPERVACSRAECLKGATA